MIARIAVNVIVVMPIMMYWLSMIGFETAVLLYLLFILGMVEHVAERVEE